jgi:hypothetical protein
VGGTWEGDGAHALDALHVAPGEGVVGHARGIGAPAASQHVECRPEDEVLKDVQVHPILGCCEETRREVVPCNVGMRDRTHLSR